MNDPGKNSERNRKDTEAKTEAAVKAIQQLLSDMQGVAQQEYCQLKLLLEEFQDVISVDDNDLCRTELVYHKIDTGDPQPVWQPARRLPFHQKEEVCHL